jgi:hypothetical protein
MEIITTTRQKDRQTYTQRWYFCSDARNKGPAVCAHSARYRADLLEADLVERFRAATTPALVDRIATALNEAIAAALDDDRRAPKKVAAEIARLRSEARAASRASPEGPRRR